MSKINENMIKKMEKALSLREALIEGEKSGKAEYSLQGLIEELDAE